MLSAEARTYLKFSRELVGVLICVAIKLYKSQILSATYNQDHEGYTQRYFQDIIVAKIVKDAKEQHYKCNDQTILHERTLSTATILYYQVLAVCLVFEAEHPLIQHIRESGKKRNDTYPQQ